MVQEAAQSASCPGSLILSASACVVRHNQEHAKHESVARELEAAREEFREFERKDIKVSPCAAVVVQKEKI